MSLTERIRVFLAAPEATGMEQTRSLRLLNTILLSLMVMTLVLAFLFKVLNGSTLTAQISLAAFLFALLSKIIMERGRPQLASWLLCLMLWGVTTAAMVNFSGIRDPVTLGYVVVITIAALLLQARGTIFYGALVVASIGIIYLIEQNERVGLPLTPAANQIDLIVITAMFIFFTFLIYYAVRTITHSYVQARQNAQALTASNRELQQTTDILYERTAHLALANQELDQFAYIAAHDLKAPLRGIANLSAWLQEDLADYDLSAESREHLQLLHKRALRMERMVAGLRRYSRVGREMEEMRDVDVGQLLGEITAVIDKPAAFVVEIAPQMPLLHTQRGRLQQVFTHLLENAIKHHDRGNGRVAISAREKGAFIQFAVRDDGPGIPHQYQAKAFAIFQILETRDKREHLGLGLPLAKKLVELAEGRIWLESNGDRGTTFYFTWPCDGRQRGDNVTTT